MFALSRYDVGSLQRFLGRISPLIHLKRVVLFHGKPDMGRIPRMFAGVVWEIILPQVNKVLQKTFINNGIYFFLYFKSSTKDKP